MSALRRSIDWGEMREREEGKRHMGHRGSQKDARQVYTHEHGFMEPFLKVRGVKVIGKECEEDSY